MSYHFGTAVQPEDRKIRGRSRITSSMTGKGLNTAERHLLYGTGW